MRKQLMVLGVAGSALLGACDLGEAGIVKCQEDQVAVIALDRDGQHDPFQEWICVYLDDFADEASVAQLNKIVAARGSHEPVCAVWPDGQKHLYSDPVGVEGEVVAC